MCECLNLLLNRFYLFKVNFLSMALDGGSMKEADGCSQWFLFFRSVMSGLEKPILAG